MKILLVNPPDELESLLGSGKVFVQKYEPLGVLYIAAVLRERGHEVSVLDCYGEGGGLEAIQARVRAFGPDVLGVSTLTCNGELVYNLGRWIKAHHPEVFVVLGNVHAATFAAEYVANGCCDAVVHGEGEEPFLKLVEHREGRRTLGQVPGVTTLDADGKVRRGCPQMTEDLTRLPRPARDLVDQRRYGLTPISNQLYVPSGRSVCKTMSTSRGCKYRCTFCVVNQRPRFHAPKQVVDEMEVLEKEFGADYVLIIDPLCMDDRPRMLDICAEIRRRGLKIKWGCDARVSCMTPELVKAMDAANCHDLSFGIESGVQTLLNNVKKGTSIPLIRKAVAMVKQHTDIRIGGLFILGLPGETEEDTLRTIAFSKELPLDMAQFSILTPYPGSALFDELAAEGKLDTGVRPDGSLDTAVWRRYSAYISFTRNEPIWVTPGLTARQLVRLQKKAQREFYLRPSQILKHIERLRPGNLLESVKVSLDAFI
jgi:anaerobic magnesium-protoporphyrin IX monomethyl ester cyclase